MKDVFFLFLMILILVLGMAAAFCILYFKLEFIKWWVIK